MPFLVTSMDWQWLNTGVHEEHREYDLLPSEYFRRQFYGCFWFEEVTALAAIDALGATNFLFETDFPHPTCLASGPVSTAMEPRAHLDRHFGHLSEQTLRRLVWSNAAGVYGVSRDDPVATGARSVVEIGQHGAAEIAAGLELVEDLGEL